MEGFLQPRVLPRVLIRAPLTNSDSHAGAILLRTKHGFMAADQAPDPTETRAWCLQESLLSPRCLVFSSLHLLWCCQQVACARRDRQYKHREAVQKRVRTGRNLRHAEKLPPVFLSNRRGSSLTSEDREELHDLWDSIMLQYSSRQLTNLDDKMRAISATVQAFQDISQDTYLAGMWGHGIGGNILWSTARPLNVYQAAGTELTGPKSSTTARKYIAPSWSWLSVLGKVRPSDFQIHAPQFKVLGFRIHLKDPAEPLGSVTGGALQVQGRLTEVLLWQDGPFSRVRKAVSSLTKRTGNPSRSFTPLARLDHDRDEGGKLWAAYDNVNDAEAWAVEVAAYPAARHSNRADAVHGSTGLLLVRTSNEQEFKRVGTYIRPKDSDIVWFDGVEVTELTVL